jgi:hypothetical protein
VSYELTLDIAEGSPEDRNIETLAGAERITREDAARRILSSSTRPRTAASASQSRRILGSFHAPDEAALLDEALDIALLERTRRNGPLQ